MAAADASARRSAGRAPRSFSAGKNILKFLNKSIFCEHFLVRACVSVSWRINHINHASIFGTIHEKDDE